MLTAQGQNGRHSFLPGGHVLPRQAVDQVQAQIFNPGGAHRRHCLLGLGKGVGPVDSGQLGVAGRLDPQGDPVHPRAAQTGEELLVHTVRVAFHGDLRVPGDGKPAAQLTEEFPQALLTVEAGGAAADIDCVHLIASGPGRRLPDMGDERLLIVVHAVLPPGQGIKIAVVTLAAAKGNVDVKTQLFGHACVSFLSLGGSPPRDTAARRNRGSPHYTPRRSLWK